MEAPFRASLHEEALLLEPPLLLRVLQRLEGEHAMLFQLEELLKKFGDVDVVFG